MSIRNSVVVVREGFCKELRVLYMQMVSAAAAAAAGGVYFVRRYSAQNAMQDVILRAATQNTHKHQLPLHDTGHVTKTIEILQRMAHAARSAACLFR